LSEEKIFELADIAQEAQAQIQRDFKDINPIVGVLTSMRASGFPADAMTIDCLVTGKRIALILHDDNPTEIAYQFGYKEKDADDPFKKIALQDVTSTQIYSWIKEYF